MISTTSAQSTTKAIQTKFMMKHKFGQNKTLPNQENAEETTKQHQIKKHLWESKHSHNLTIAGLLAELNQNLSFDYPIILEVWTDSQPVIALLEKNNSENTHLQHIDIWCHWILEYIKKSQTVVK